jgi:hypothetical protein
MPTIELSTDELRRATQACRIGAAQAQQDADRQDDGRIKTCFIEAAERYSTLASKFESAREKCK